MSALTKDSELSFPHYMVLKASAGAGKTRALTSRYVQFLLSENIPQNKLQNVLAITFSNNAAKEMKERILGWLKKLYFKDKDAVRGFSNLLDIKLDGKTTEEVLSQKAENLLEEILNNYSDFQVKTIDSFMTSLFKACAVDFGYDPDFDILMNNEELLSYSFDLFLSDIRDGTNRAKDFEELIELLEEKGKNSSYKWEPDKDIFEKWKGLYRHISSNTKEIVLKKELVEEKRDTEEELYNSMINIKRFLDTVDPKFLNGKFNHERFTNIIEKRDFPDLLSTGLKSMPVRQNNVPQNILTEIRALWQEFQSLLSRYASYYSLTYYQPYIERFHDFLNEIEKTKLREGALFIEDINKKLVSHLNSYIIPDIYFRLGEKILHFLVDEFQDTSPLQWNNLIPLIENALSTGGSLFIVGDTKQAIYGFRGADYRIMKRLEDEVEKVFPQADLIKKELDINYRCSGEVLSLADSLFKEIIPSIDKYSYAAGLSGLSDYNQRVLPEKQNRGYVEVKNLKEENIKGYLCTLIEDLRSRGYSFSDIAILSFRNEEVVRLSEWLNEHDLPFISYSSLDVRKRKVTSEILHLLRFLDSPLDDFSFSVFLQGEIYKNFLMKKGLSEEDINNRIQHFLLKNRGTRLYKSFEREFPELWKDHFEKLFKLSGYLPFYDLLSMIETTFRLYECMPDEEAAFLKIFELARLFEKNGFGNIKDFIEFMSGPGDDKDIWDISLPADADAIKLMTLHKSKGLEFPVTILYLPSKLNKGKEDSFVSYETEKGIFLMKLTGEIAQKNEQLNMIYNNREINKITTNLNLLYVGITRAKEELYVMLVDKGNGGEDNDTTTQRSGDSFPSNIFDRLREKERGRKPLPEEVKEIKERSHEGPAESLKISHQTILKRFPVEKKEIHIYEKVRGEFIHSILATVEYYHEGSSQEIYKTIEKLNKRSFIKFIPETIHAQVIRTIEYLYPYFKQLPRRSIKNEKEFSDRFGALHRMDRVIIDPDIITVIDYKTGNPDEEEKEEHIRQLSLYKEILREVYPSRDVKGLLFYIDREEQVEI